MQQSQSYFSFVSAIFCIILRCIRLAGRGVFFAHAGRAHFPYSQALALFLLGLAAPGVRPASQVEGLLNEPDPRLYRFVEKFLSPRGPLPSTGRPSQHSARSFIPHGLPGPGYVIVLRNGGP